MMCSATNTLAVCYEQQANSCEMLEKSKTSETLLPALTSSMTPCCVSPPPTPRDTPVSSSTNTSASESADSDDEQEPTVTSQLPRMCSMTHLMSKLQARAEAQMGRSGGGHLAAHLLHFVTAAISLTLARSLLV